LLSLLQTPAREGALARSLPLVLSLSLNIEGRREGVGALVHAFKRVCVELYVC
jgi:hypothetical protein